MNRESGGSNQLPLISISLMNLQQITLKICSVSLLTSFTCIPEAIKMQQTLLQSAIEQFNFSSLAPVKTTQLHIS